MSALPAVALALFVLAPGAQKIPLKEAESMALAGNARLRAQAARSKSARKAADAKEGRYLFSVHLSEEAQHYDSPFEVAFSTGGASPTSPPFRVRDQNVNTFSVAAEQPLLGLLRLHAEASAEATSADARDQEAAGLRAAVLEAIEKGYLRYFEAKALEEIAAASKSELEDQVRLAEAKLKAGVFTEAEVLRVKVALANAKQQEIVAHAQGEIARTGLYATIGLPIDAADVELEEPTDLLDKAEGPLPEVQEAKHDALSQRPEVAARTLDAEAAERRSRASFYALLPEIDAEAAYLRLDGQIFAPPNSAFLGLKASWPIWEWGAGYRAHESAGELAEALRFEKASTESQVAVEAVTAIHEATAARNAVKVAREAISGAEEAYRETTAQVRAGTATTTDLLDAQAALTQAKLNLSRARYEQAIARVSIARATGALR